MRFQGEKIPDEILDLETHLAVVYHVDFLIVANAFLILFILILENSNLNSNIMSIL